MYENEIIHCMKIKVKVIFFVTHQCNWLVGYCFYEMIDFSIQYCVDFGHFSILQWSSYSQFNLFASLKFQVWKWNFLDYWVDFTPYLIWSVSSTSTCPQTKTCQNKGSQNIPNCSFKLLLLLGFDHHFCGLVKVGLLLQGLKSNFTAMVDFDSR